MAMSSAFKKFIESKLNHHFFFYLILGSVGVPTQIGGECNVTSGWVDIEVVCCINRL